MSNLDSPIMPSVGRVVLVRGINVSAADPDREYPALVTAAWSQNCINAHVFNEEPGGKVITSIPYSEGSVPTKLYAAWRWMPYQVTQAAKAEIKEAAV